jgi:hypothetical protein
VWIGRDAVGIALDTKPRTKRSQRGGEASHRRNEQGHDGAGPDALSHRDLAHVVVLCERTTRWL